MTSLIVFTEAAIPVQQRPRPASSPTAQDLPLIARYRALVEAHPHAKTTVDQAVLILGLHPDARSCNIRDALQATNGQAKGAVANARRKLQLAGWTRGGSRTGVLTSLCPECGQRFLSTGPGRTYCSDRCYCTSRYVRYHRKQLAVHSSWEEMPADIREAVNERRAHAVSEKGYQSTARRILPARRVDVWERDGGLCVHCGKPGAEIDHIDGDSSALTNLRLLCKSCHKAVTRAHYRPHDVESLMRAFMLDERVNSPEPLNPQDGPAWKQLERTWRRDHLQLEPVATP